MIEAGIELDAEFAVDLVDGQPAFTMFSHSGSSSGRPRRNPQYGDALRVILRRLGDYGARITDALVVSSDALRDWPDPADRRLTRGVQFPIYVAGHDVGELRTALTESMRATARDPSLGPGGNNRRRVTFWLDVPGNPGVADLAAYLSGSAPLAPSGPSAGTTNRVGQAGEVPLTMGPPAVRHSRAQGYVADAAYRRAVELHAMAVAITHYGGDWDVEDTSAGNPYDLVLTRDGETRYVEVKGTAGSGDQISLTANEVKHARRHRPNVVLFVVHSIAVDRRIPERPVASVGITAIVDPFDIDAGELHPTAFTWSRPSP